MNPNPNLNLTPTPTFSCVQSDFQISILKQNIEKKEGKVNVNTQTKVGVGVILRLGFMILKKRKAR